MFVRLSHAARGVFQAFLNDSSVRMQIIIALGVFLAGIITCISALKLIIIVIVSSSVVAAEIFNSSIENFANHVHPKQHAAVKKTKDLAAGAVLIVSVSAFFVGLFIFVPALMAWEPGSCLIPPFFN